MANANTIFITTSCFERTVLKCGDRGYRFLLMEIGSAMQNFSLISACLGLGICQIGGFHDDAINDFLGADGVHERVQSVALLGKSKS